MTADYTFFSEFEPNTTPKYILTKELYKNSKKTRKKERKQLKTYLNHIAKKSKDELIFMTLIASKNKKIENRKK